MLGFASPWPPSPTLLITSRRGGMRWSRVGCLSLGIDSPPFYGPPLCPLRPSKLSPTTPNLSFFFFFFAFVRFVQGGGGSRG